MKSGWNDFQSPLAQGIKAYLASKRALGKQFKSEEEALRLLDRYLIGLSLTNIADITPAILEAFLGSRSRNRPTELQPSSRRGTPPVRLASSPGHRTWITTEDSSAPADGEVSAVHIQP